MIKVAVASQNVQKIEAVREGIQQIYPKFTIEGFKTESGVADQPWGDEEILKGAYNRAFSLASSQPEFDFCVGAEGGLVEKFGLVYDYAYIVIVNKNGQVGVSRTSEFLVPDNVVVQVMEGKELGPVLDEFFQSSPQESMHNLTDGAMSRATFYAPAVLLAMSRFLHPDWYQDPQF